MDKQPSEAARNAMYAALVEHDALDLNPRYPTARGVLRIDPLVTILADYAERYAAERERAARTDALEQACKAVCLWCAAGKPRNPQYWEYHGWWVEEGRGRQELCKAAAIRALMNEPNETKPAGADVHKPKETTNE